jgi:hypothetical protein
MCEISDKIKFCSCSVPSIESLKHYWVFHKIVKGKFLYIIGEPVWPHFLNKEIEKCNKAILLKRVNEIDAFDIQLNPKSKDRFQISIHCENPIDHYIHYGFVFKQNRWVEYSYDAMKWMWRHEEENFGNIESAII